MKINMKTIRQVARHYRKWAEKNAEFFGFDASDLSCMCCIASYEIFKALKSIGYPARFCENDLHAFVMIHDIVIDVTATQFDKKLKEVIVMKHSSLPIVKNWDNIWWCRGQACDFQGAKKLISQFPTDQQPKAVRVKH